MACERDPSARMRNPGASGPRTEREEVPMAIVGGLDIHRRQITYDWIDTDSGETCRGQLGPATRRVPRAPGRPGRHPGAARSQAARQTDRIDARHLRELLGAGTLPESWMPPA